MKTIKAPKGFKLVRPASAIKAESGHYILRQDELEVYIKYLCGVLNNV